MNTAGHHRDADRRATSRRRGYRIPHIIYADAYFSEMVAYADLVLPDTTYLERYDCISLLDRPISKADAAADAIRQPVVAPDRDVRPFQDVLIDLGARLELPGLVDRRRQRRDIPGSMPTTSSITSASPASACSRAGAARTASKHGSGEPNPNQLEHYIANGCFWQHEIAPRASAISRHANKDYLEWAVAMGFIDQPEPDGAAALQRGAAEIPPRRRGPWRGAAARARPRRASRLISIRCRSGTGPSSRQRGRRRRISRCTPSPSGRWPCITPGVRRMPGCARSTAAIACSSIASMAEGARPRR